MVAAATARDRRRGTPADNAVAAATARDMKGHAEAETNNAIVATTARDTKEHAGAETNNAVAAVTTKDTEIHAYRASEACGGLKVRLGKHGCALGGEGGMGVYKRDDGGQQKNLHEQVVKLLEDQGKDRLGLLGRQLVVAVHGARLFNLSV